MARSSGEHPRGVSAMRHHICAHVAITRSCSAHSFRAGLLSGARVCISAQSRCIALRWCVGKIFVIARRCYRQQGQQEVRTTSATCSSGGIGGSGSGLPTWASFSIAALSLGAALECATPPPTCCLAHCISLVLSPTDRYRFPPSGLRLHLPTPMHACPNASPQVQWQLTSVARAAFIRSKDAASWDPSSAGCPSSGALDPSGAGDPVTEAADAEAGACSASSR